MASPRDDHGYEDAVTDYLEGTTDSIEGSPEWYPGWGLPPDSDWLQQRMREREGRLRPDDVCYIVNEPSTFPGEQPVAIVGQLRLDGTEVGRADEPTT